jgi:hypothetical protein
MTAVPDVYIFSTGLTLVFEHFQQCWEFYLARQVQIRGLSTNEMKSPWVTELGATAVLRSEEITVTRFAECRKDRVNAAQIQEGRYNRMAGPYTLV